jgi:CheY-like chemotaxis protein
MDDAHSQPCDALRFVHELVRGINGNPQEAARLLEPNGKLWDGLKSFLTQLVPTDKTSPCEKVEIPTQTEPERLREELGNFLFDNSNPDERVREELENFLALFERPKQRSPREDPHTTGNNSPTDSMKIDPIIPNDLHDVNAAESDCSAATVPPSFLETRLPRWSLQPPRVSPTPMNGRKRCALVIEHNKSLSGMFTAFLKSHHYLVRTVYKSEDALHLYRDCAPFELVLIDYRMPKRNGIDIGLDILKEDPAQPMMIFAPGYQTEDEVPRREELVNVPFLLDMSHSGYSRFRTILEQLQPSATREEVDWAITALTAAELLRLQKYADSRVCLFRGTDHRTGEDLLQEALRLTIDGHRRWYKRVTFATHLLGVVQSITRRRKGDINLWCDILEYDAEGHEHCRLDTIESRDPSPEQLLMAEETLRGFLERFKDDPKARLVLQVWSEGMTRKEIMQEGLSENEYRAAVKRIRMKLLTPPNGGRGGEKHDRQD